MSLDVSLHSFIGILIIFRRILYKNCKISTISQNYPYTSFRMFLAGDKHPVFKGAYLPNSHEKITYKSDICMLEKPSELNCTDGNLSLWN